MNTMLSGASAVGYRYILKPILFRQKPDTVHRRMLRTGAKLQRSSAVCGLAYAAWAYECPEKLSQTVAGVHFANPVGLSAGFDKNFELPFMLKAVGFGFMEGGSITYQPCAGNPRPWFHRLPKSRSLVVHAGLGNDGSEVIIRRLLAYPSHLSKGFPFNISVAKTNSPEACTEAEAIADYIGTLKAIKRARVGEMITINISCPNTYGGEPFTTPAMLEHLLAQVDALHIAHPIFLKMPSHLPWEEFDALLEVAAKHSITGVTISNLAKQRDKLRLADPLPDSIKGGLSGKPTWETSNMLIKRTYQKYGRRFVIIGVGGIFSAEDAYTKIRLGATLVELITGMVFEGPQLIGAINHGLVKLLERDRFNHISEVVGIDAY